MSISPPAELRYPPHVIEACAAGSAELPPRPDTSLADALLAGGRGANARQVGGAHYQELAIQPWDAVHAWGLGFFDGNAVAYIARWKRKGGVEDLKKAVHFLEKLIELEAP